LALPNTAVHAQDQIYDFEIHEEPLSASLQEFAHISGRQIIFTEDLVAGVMAKPLHGRFDAEDALSQLLAGTGLTVEHANSGALMVRPIRQADTDLPVTVDSAAPEIEMATVTGSRVIATAGNSPTPITTISTQALQQTTPMDIATALNKLPIFFGSATPGDPNNTPKFIGNVLNLRNFGPQRTLVLVDGHRQAPSNPDGTIDIDTLPQALIQRVDIVTGGASAVYGSDAVTGVVNFVLNDHFNGVALDANAGISGYGDAAMQQLNIVAGTNILGGRGHLEGSLRYFHQDGVLLSSRPWGPATSWTATGSGTLSQPVTPVSNARFNNFAFGGLIVNCGGCAASGMQFTSNGVLGAFNPGIPTYSSTIVQGGDGVYTQASNMLSLSQSYQGFGRFSYDLTNSVTGYIQLLAAQGLDSGYHVGSYVQSGAYPKNVFVNNPFLTSQAQTLLANPTGMFTDQQYFQFPYYQGYLQKSLNRNLNIEGGLNGKVSGRLDWNLYLSYGEDRLKYDSPYDQSDAKLAAAMDAVVNPATGNIVCEVSLTQFAALYPGCIPMNRFGPTAATTNMMNYVFVDTNAVTKQSQLDVSGSVSGPLLRLPAGFINAAISGEYRELSYGVIANSPPGFVDCTGLRLCVPSMPQTMHGVYTSAPTAWDDVWELAGEADVPLLKGQFLAQSLDLNLAGRFTDYRESGSVETWKIGVDYHVNDAIHFRATTSVDIRAPTLQDLFAPQNISHIGFADPHTGNQYQQVTTLSQGNPALVPEVARTYTAGVVLTPAFLPKFQISADYYQIVLKNVINDVSGTAAGVAQACEDSSGTSNLCSLFIRPLPFLDHSAANYPSAVLSQNLNASLANTGGVDIELNYGFDLNAVWKSVPGEMTLRSFLSYQPNNSTYSFVGAPVTALTAPKSRLTAFATYDIGDWSFSAADRFTAKYNQSPQPDQFFYVQTYASAMNYIDFTVSRKFKADEGSYELYGSVQNLMDTPPPINPAPNTIPGYKAYGQAPRTGVDNVGRYFILGVRVSP